MRHNFLVKFRKLLEVEVSNAINNNKVKLSMTIQVFYSVIFHQTLLLF